MDKPTALETAKIAYHALCRMVDFHDRAPPFETLPEEKKDALIVAVNEIGAHYVKVWTDDLAKRHPRNMRNIEAREAQAVLICGEPTDIGTYDMQHLLPDATDWAKAQGKDSLEMACATLASIAEFNGVSFAGQVAAVDDKTPTMICVMRGERHCAIALEFLKKSGTARLVNLVEADLVSSGQDN